ncbi:hypothetical protein [Kitasatospora sp. NPDC005856]|uniref:hypothetical protein n=1 Tax=Kitasatospora sp. NPDC005856 TaxID=3154566 RepID=UPI0033FA26D9
MAVREDTPRDVRHEPARQARHGRPRPFGGRFRLPTLRFSGAAMAMSTVVGISIATTLLLNEQQGIGRRAGVARVGSTPPPTPGATDRAEAVSAQTPADGRSSAPSDGHPAAGRPSTGPSAHLSARPSGPAPVAATPPAPRTAGPGTPQTGGQTGGQASAGQDAPAPGTQLTGTEAGAPAPAGPSPSPSASVPGWDAKQPGYAPSVPSAPDQGSNAPGPRPIAPNRPVPPPAAPLPDTGVATGVPGKDAPADPAEGTGPAGPGSVPDSDPASVPDTDHALTGAGLLSPLGRDGLRHRLTLAVAEPVTAFQAEFRLAPGESAPGTGAAWTDLPGAVVTAQQERGTLVYRFTTPPGTDVRPGHYTFAVRGARTAAESSAAVRKAPPAESWSASAFALDHPRAVAALGGFGPAQPPPVAPGTPGTPDARAAAPLPRPTVGPDPAPAPAPDLVPALEPATGPATAAR